MQAQNPLIRMYHRVSLVNQIIIGLIAGSLLAYASKEWAMSVAFLGNLFVGALKGVAPILVFVLVTASIANHKQGQKSGMRPLLMLYMIGTLSAALLAVVASFMFPSELQMLNNLVGTDSISPPSGIKEVLFTLMFKMIDNPFNAVIQANYIGLLVWGVALGTALRHGSETTKMVVNDLSQGVTFIVRLVIRLAPIGLFGLVASTFAEEGFEQLRDYIHLLVVLVSCMVIVALVINPLIVFLVTRRNPYPLVLTVLKESGIPAFFTRSSAANIPVNLALCKKLNFDESTYSVAVPLGATINMSGAAITITVLTLAATYTLGIQVDLFTALLLSVVAAVCACGASGVAGGSLLLIPVACSMFGIPNDIAMKVVSVGLIIGVIQDSAETALNSSTDVVMIGAVCQAEKNRQQS